MGGVFHPDGAAALYGGLANWDGSAWTSKGVGSDLLFRRNITGIWRSSPNDIWAVAGANTALHYDGEQWTAVAAGRTQGLAAIAGRSSDDIVAVGPGRKTLHYDGFTWRDWDLSVADDAIVGAWASGDDDIWAVTPTTLIHHDGRGWSKGSIRWSGPFVGVSGVSRDHVVALEQEGSAVIWYRHSIGFDMLASAIDRRWEPSRSMTSG